MKLKNKQINVISEFWPPNIAGGGEISTYYVCKQLVEYGYNITVITPNPNYNNDKFDFIRTTNPHWIHGIFEKNYYSKIRLDNEVKKGIFWASDFYGAALLNNWNVKKIVTVRDYWPIFNQTGAKLKEYSLNDWNIIKKLSHAFRYYANIAFRQSLLLKFNKIIFISNFLSKIIIPKISKKTFSVINNPIPWEYINKPVSKKKIFNKIIYVGAVIEYKGISVLIRAMKEITKLNNKITLLIAGKIIDDYKKQIKQLNIARNIRFLGDIRYDKIMSYYDQCDMVIAPSLWLEPFGRTIIEGMARKCIVIATNHAGPAELITNEKNGFLFEKGNYHQLAKIVIDLYQKPKTIQTIQTNARNFAIKYFSPDVITQYYEKIFQSIA